MAEDARNRFILSRKQKATCHDGLEASSKASSEADASCNKALWQNLPLDIIGTADVASGTAGTKAATQGTWTPLLTPIFEITPT